MGRYGIDYMSVKGAAEALAAAGDSVTVEKIRLALGSGSFTTLGKHLRTWRRTQDPAVGHPDSMPEMINDAAQAVWNNLSRAAEERIAEAQAAAQTAVAAAQDAAQEQLMEASQGHAEASRAAARELQHLQERFDACTEELTGCLERQQDMAAAREQEALRATRAEGALEQAEARLDGQGQEIARIASSLQRAETLVAAQEQALADARQELQRAVQQHQEVAHKTEQRWQREREALQRQVAREQQEFDRLRAQHSVYEEMLQHLHALREAEAGLAQRDEARSTHEKLMTGRLRALEQQTGEIIVTLQSVVQATQDKTVHRLLEQGQQATQDLYQNLMGAVASWTPGSAPKA